MNLWELIVAAILGLVEGLTEFAPVSSTGHMILVDDLWLHSNTLYTVEVANVFKVIIQLGAILAVVVVFYRRFLNLVGLMKAPPTELIIKPQISLKAKQAKPVKAPRLKLRHVFAGLLPAGVLGFLFEDLIDKYLFSIPTVLAALVVGAIFMAAAEWFGPRIPKIETVDQLTVPKAFAIGVFQCISLWPGFSRSGSTISAGVILGLSYRAAADFSFIMSVPIMLGASALTLLKHREAITPHTLPFFAVGFICAFLCSLVVIHFFLQLISKVKLVPFAVYRVILAAAIAAVLYIKI